MGFHILATNGTAEALRNGGVESKEVLKVSEGRPNVVDYMKNRNIQLVINTPSREKQAKADGYIIRRSAVELNIPYITTISAALATVNAIDKIRSGELAIKSMQEYLAG
jgi:carbamoyl-phosphate synthase large subunit